MPTDEEDEEYFGSPAFQQVLTRYEQAVRRGESVYMEADELTDIAEYYMTREREQDADRVISLAVALHPDSVDPQVFLARRQLFVGNTREALRISRAIIDQEDREVKFLNAEILIKEGYSRKAVAYLLDVWRHLEGDRDHFLYDTAGIFMDYNLWEYALMWLNRLERLCPAYPKLRRAKAEVMVCLERYDEAMPLLNQLLDEDPYQKEVWNLLAESQGATERYADAIESAGYVLAIDVHNSRAMATKGSCLYHMNQPHEAHQLYLASLEQDPHDAHVLYLDAVCLASLMRFDEAKEQIESARQECVEDAPLYVHILIEQAYIDCKLHHFTHAMQALDEAERMYSGDMNCEFSLLRGQVYLENDHDQEAMKCFGEALRQSANKRNTLMVVGVAFGEAEHYEAAIRVMLTVQRTFPDCAGGASPVPYLAFYYYKSGNLQRSLSYLQQAAQVDRDTTEQLFAPIYPGVVPDEYYLYAYRNLYGHFPDEEK